MLKTRLIEALGHTVLVQSETRGGYLAYATIRRVLFESYPDAKTLAFELDTLRRPEIANPSNPSESERAILAAYDAQINAKRSENRAAAIALDQISTFATIGAMIRESASLGVQNGRMDTSLIGSNFEMYLSEEDGDGLWYEIAKAGTDLRSLPGPDPDPMNGDG